MARDGDMDGPTRRRPRRVTASDVAEAAAVSRAAVSRAFAKSAYLDPAKRALILETAKRLGYRPNALAASLQGMRTDLVGIVAGDLAREYDSAFVSVLVSALNASGKWPLVLSGSEALNTRSIRSVFGYPLDAMIVRGGSVPTAAFADAAQLNIPIIFSGRVAQASLADCICCRNQDGARMAIEAMLGRGRRRFGYIGGPADWSSEIERQAGVHEALRDADLRLIGQTHADYTFQGGRDAALQMLKDRDLDALFCANDAMALGALSAARQMPGHQVPETLSIIGFDDIPMAAWPEFDLTTVRNPVRQTVSEILRLLDARLSDPTRDGEVIMIAPELVERGTH